MRQPAEGLGVGDVNPLKFLVDQLDVLRLLREFGEDAEEDDGNWLAEL